MKNLLLVCLFTLCCAVLISQNKEEFENTEQHIAELLEHYAEESGEDFNIEMIMDDLYELTENPIDLNLAEREALEAITFLSDMQIENILYYRYKVEQFVSIYELQLVDGLDMTDIRRILPFVKVGNPLDKAYDKIDWKKAMKYGRNEVLARMDYTPEQKAGYIKGANDSAKYAGIPLYHHLKYRYHYQNRLFVNLTVEQDAGEAFWSKEHKGYDFLSGSIQLKDGAYLKNLIVGDYQVGFGQGLAIRQTFNMGKSAIATNISNNNQGFKRYGSSNEFNFMRGLATSWEYWRFQLDLFYSYRKMDGTVQADDFTGFYATGYHRTANEIAKRKRIEQQVGGAHLLYKDRWFQVGLNTIGFYLDKNLKPKAYPYNHFYFKGDKQWTSSLHYRLRWHKFNIFGEIALSDFKHPAIINGLTCAAVSRVNFALLHRYIPPEFNAFYASTFTASSGANNENGIYIGAEVLPAKYWKMAFYADIYSFPWLRYGVDFPSSGYDYLLQLNYTPSRRLNVQIRTRYKHSENNPSGSKAIMPILSNEDKLSLRLQSIYDFGKIKFKSILDGNLFFIDEQEPTYGLAALQEFSLKMHKIPLQFDLSYLIFDAKDYVNRLYMYEKDVLYAFSIPSFSGVGCKYYIHLKYDITRKLSCWLKVSQLHYTDYRDQIGSSYEAIQGDRKTEIKFLVRQKF